MSENQYWLVAVPGDPRPEDSWKVLSDRVKNHAAVFKFPIPELKVSQVMSLICTWRGSIRHYTLRQRLL